jgi:predicted kinase
VIITLRGTSGTGKTTLVRKIKEQYHRKEAHYVDGRKQPIRYTLRHENGRSLSVLGSYETTCGGCDTIKTLDQMFELARESHYLGHDVLMEGLLLSPEKWRTVALHTNGLPVLALALDIPLEVCLDRVNARRKERVEAHNAKNPHKPKEATPVKVENTEFMIRRVNDALAHFHEQGVPYLKTCNDNALRRMMQEFGL